MHLICSVHSIIGSCMLAAHPVVEHVRTGPRHIPPGVQQGTDGPRGVAGNNRIFMACRRGPVKFVRSVGSVFSGLVRSNGSSRKMHAADAIEQRVRCSATCTAIPGARPFSSTYGALLSPLEPSA